MIWGKHIHTVVFRLPDSWSNWNLKMFLSSGENRSNWRKTFRSKGEHQQLTQPTRVLSPLRYPCSPSHKHFRRPFLDLRLAHWLIASVFPSPAV